MAFPNKTVNPNGNNRIHRDGNGRNPPAQNPPKFWADFLRNGRNPPLYICYLNSTTYCDRSSWPYIDLIFLHEHWGGPGQYDDDDDDDDDDNVE